MPHKPPKPGRRRLLRRTLFLLLGIGLMVALLGSWGIWRLRASLPQLAGEVVVSGLRGPVTIERDDLGIPTIRGGTRLDVAFATGFVHAQDRFFQMDLARRRAAGELAELFGSGALTLDKRVRRHRLRNVARAALARADAPSRALLSAYGAGVQAGLSALAGKPFEHTLTFSQVAPWKEEDTHLVVLAMFLQLQDSTGRRELALGLMADSLPAPLFEFLTPVGTEWDAPLLGEPWVTPPLPGPEVVDLRQSKPSPKVARASLAVDGAPWLGALVRRWPGLAGSNAWAVAGDGAGGALVANDMHLGLTVPNVWYRAVFEWTDADGVGHRVVGATLPGTPAMIVGSNGRVAWGFTNSYLDTSDVVLLERGGDGQYMTADGPEPFGRHREQIRVRGGDSEVFEVRTTRWGPVLGEDYRGRPYAFSWVAHFPDAVDLGLLGMETAADVESAVEVAAASGLPAQNIVIADASGRIGWTYGGRLPHRQGFSGRLPASWAEGERRWAGWLTPRELPRLVDPPHGRIWSANHRNVGGEALDKVGDAGYALGARAAQIRDRLGLLEAPQPQDMLALQLEDRVSYLEPWRRLYLSLPSQGNQQSTARTLVAGWDGSAAAGSLGYPLLTAFRREVLRRAVSPLLAAAREHNGNLAMPPGAQIEGPVWRLLEERPLHLLDPAYDGWDHLLAAARDAALEGQDLSTPWGERNAARIRHPLSRLLPPLARWLDMPADPLPGCIHCPRVGRPGFGASQRMAVSPGREAEGYFHMPGGQSGHPFSPHYRDGHAAWVRGEPTPFLPGATRHRLTLIPSAE